jgi:hypothetical protein
VPRPRTKQPNFGDIAEQVAEVAVDAFVDRAYDAIERLRAGQLSPKALPKEYLFQEFTCVACRKPFPISELEMVHPANGFATCKGCYAFMWEAAEQKLKFLAKQAAARAQGRQGPAPGPTAPQPPRMRPWEILGVAQDATEEEIKKAYRKLALECHPDTLADGATFEEKAAAKERFLRLTKAKDAMLSVRKAAEAKP